jgi:magnesium transporter
MIRTLLVSKDGVNRIEANTDAVEATLQQRGAWVWVSLEEPTPDEFDLVLNRLFHFHPLAVEDCQSVGYQTPKVDDYDDYVFIIAHAICANHKLDQLDTAELDIFLGNNYVVTSYHPPEMRPVQDVWKNLDRDDRLIRRGPDYLCHEVLDILVDYYMPLLDEIDEEVESLEDAVIDQPTRSTLERILAIKHTMLVLRRIINPQRDVMNRLSRDEYKQINRSTRIYFRDIYDHLVRIEDLIETVRDIISSTLDTYLSATSNRLNEVMKALTIVSTIFLPLSFVAGIYGMNFEFMPEIHWRYGYLFVWGVFVVVTIVFIWWFKRRNWF